MLMKDIKVLGSGCTKCVKTAEIIQTVAAESHVPVSVVKETSPEVMMSYGVMSTPAVVIDDVLVHAGSIPDRKKIEAWLSK
jgi:predicted thioredoxin/glutaredoxin